jgi:hypothetical protein
MSVFSLGVSEGADRRSWALIGRGPSGWALIDADDGDLSEPLGDAVNRWKTRWPKRVRPRLALPFEEARIRPIVGDRPEREIIAAERLEWTGTDELLVTVVPFGEDRLAVSVPRTVVESALGDWRDLGIEPVDIEPLEIAWARAFPDDDAILHAPTLERGFLVTFGDRVFMTERLPNFADGDLTVDEIAERLVQSIRGARATVERLRHAVAYGEHEPLTLISDRDGDLVITPLRVAGEASPVWSDAFVIALGAAVEDR